MLRRTGIAMVVAVTLICAWMVFSANAAGKPELYLENNVLAAGNYNAGPTSSDITLIVRIEANGEILVDEGMEVAYIVPQKDIKDWIEVDFDDSDWQRGISGVGYGDGDDNTGVRGGNVLSVYTRYYFDAPNARNIEEITIMADYDDGYILWLNGEYIAGTVNAPGGEAPPWNTNGGGHGASELPAGRPNEARWNQANLDINFVPVDFGGQEPEGVQVNPPGQGGKIGAPLYLKGNVLAGGNFNDGPDSSDMTLIMRLMGDGEIYVDEGYDVKYIHDPDNADVPDDWIQPEFDDSAWADGRSGVGFSDGDDNTVTPAGLISIWTRYYFDAPNANKISELILLSDSDDAYIAWLNGVPIGFSSGAPAGDPPAWDVSQGGVSGDEASCYPAGEPNKARWSDAEIETTVVPFYYAGTSALGVDARRKLSTTWGRIKEQD